MNKIYVLEARPDDGYYGEPLALPYFFTEEQKNEIIKTAKETYGVDEYDDVDDVSGYKLLKWVIDNYGNEWGRGWEACYFTEIKPYEGR